MKFDVYIPQGNDVFCEADDPTARGIWLTIDGELLPPQVKALAEARLRHLGDMESFTDGYTDIVLRVFEDDLDGMDRTASDPA